MQKPIAINLQLSIDPLSEAVTSGGECAHHCWTKMWEDKRDTACERAAKGLAEEMMAAAIDGPPATLAAHLYGAFKVLLERSVQPQEGGAA